jgi:Na+/proline symporter
MSIVNWIIFSICIAAFVLYGLCSSFKVRSESNYLLANRSVRLFSLVATLVMTEFNTATLLSFSAAGYYANFWALSLSFVFLIGLLFYAWAVAKPWKRFNGLSVAYFFYRRYGRDVGYFVAAILFLAMLGFSAVYLKSLTLLFSPIFPALSLWQLSAGLVLIIFLMVSFGGLFTIVRMDMISFCLIILLFPLLLYYASILPSTTGTVHSASLAMMQAALPTKFVLSLIFLTMFSYILAPWYGQKIVAAHSDKTAFTAVIIAAVLIALLYGIGIGASALLKTKGIPLSNPEFAIPYLINYATPYYFKGIAYVIFFSIGATTLVGIWNAMVALLISRLSGENRLWRSYSLKLTCVLLSFLGANIFNASILNTMLLANIPIVALSFALLAGFYWRRVKRISVYLSTITGITWGIFCYLYYGEQRLYTWHWAIVGIPLIFTIGVISTLCFEKGHVAERSVHRFPFLPPLSSSSVETAKLDNE